MKKERKVYFNKEFANICIFFTLIFSFLLVYFIRKGNLGVSIGFGFIVFLLLWVIYHIITQKHPPTQQRHDLSKTIYKPEHEYASS